MKGAIRLAVADLCVLDPSPVSNYKTESAVQHALYICLPACLCSLSIYLSIDLPAGLSVHLSESDSVHLSRLFHSLSTPSRALTLQVKSPDLIT
jgi:hypothetical protein